ncbi:MAG TPA: flagellar basal-body rod protein FlgF [Acidimicrobiales bacterium]
MFSAISGLRNHQSMMDVVGNNIANVNTTGFKSSAVVFQDVLSQTLRGAGAATDELGGTNPAQVGLGSRVAAVTTNFAQGALQRTGRATDLAIQGDGFFVVEQAGQALYTRAGSFSVDALGRLVTQEGALVMGWQADPAGELDTNAAVQALQIPVGDLIAPVLTSQITLGGNLPSDAEIGTTVVSSVTVYDSQGAAIDLTYQFTKVADNEWGVSASYGSGTSITLTGLTSATNPVVEAASVADTDAFDFSAANAQFTIDAGGGPVTVTLNTAYTGSTIDDLVAFVQTAVDGTALAGDVTVSHDGDGHLTFTRTDATGPGASITLTGVNVTALDQLGIGTTAVAASGYDTIQFDASGELTSPFEFTIPGGQIPGIATAITVSLGDAKSPNRITQYGELSTLTALDQDGSGPGSLQSFTVSQEGLIVGSYSNGRTRTIGQLALAVFSNPEGLEKVGGSNYRPTPNSGLAQLGTAGIGGRGLLATGTLEMSNVDLAQEFTNLIVAQRGFQANSRVVTTSDELLSEVVNLKR